MDKIRSKSTFRKERSLFFIFLTLCSFLLISVLVHRFYNPAIIEAAFTSIESSKLFGEIELDGTTLSFSVQPTDSLYKQPIMINLKTRNYPDSLYVWQNGKRIPAVKNGDNSFTVSMPAYSEMVAEFIK